MINTNKKIILIIEDDAFAVKAYQLRLERENIHVQVATTGVEAMTLLEGVPPNIVLLDIMLPGINGMEVLNAIRKSKTWKDVPVIVLSNLGQIEDINHAKALGANDYAVKANTRIDDVIAIINKYL